VKTINIIFDGRFVEVENAAGESISFGEWVKHGDGLWSLRITANDVLSFFHDKSVFIAWGNDDLTEGRGLQYPLFVCASPTTAARLGSKRYVQGCDCPVTEEKAFIFGGQVYAPTRIRPPSKEDISEDKIAEKSRIAQDKALKAGLTEEDIAALRGRA